MFCYGYQRGCNTVQPRATRIHLVAKPIDVKRSCVFLSIYLLMCLRRETFVSDEETYLVHL